MKTILCVLLICMLISSVAFCDQARDFEQISELFHNADYFKVTPLCKRFIKIYPDSPLIYDVLYILARSTGNYSEAVNSLERIINECSEEKARINARFDLLQLLYLKGDFQGILQRFKNSSAEQFGEGNQPEALFYISEAFIQNEEYNRAVSKLTSLTIAYPSDRFAHLAQAAIAYCYLKMNKPDMARAQISMLMEATDSAMAISRAKEILAMLGDENMSVSHAAEHPKRGSPIPQAMDISPVEPSTIPTEQPTEKKVYYSVQVGAYAIRENALKRQKELEEIGYEVMINKAVVQGRTLYRLRIGNFDTLEQAQIMQKKLQSQGIACFISQQ